MGRPPHQPGPTERRQVEAMAGYGVPEADIARVIGIDPKTLRKHYRDELDTGHILANAKVAESLFRKATGDGRQSVTAAIFWLKTRAGWREADRTAAAANAISAAEATEKAAQEFLDLVAAQSRRIGVQETLAGAGDMPASADRTVIEQNPIARADHTA